MRSDDTTPEGGDSKDQVSAMKRERPVQVAMLATILAGVGVVRAWAFADPFRRQARTDRA